MLIVLANGDSIFSLELAFKLENMKFGVKLENGSVVWNKIYFDR